MHIWEIKEKEDMQANCYEELGTRCAEAMEELE